MKVRTLARSLVMVGATFALLAVLPVSGAALAQPAQTIKLKIADSLPTTHYVVLQAVRPWMDRVVQLSKTKVEFEYFPSEQLGKLSDMVNLLRTGVADIAYTAPAAIPGDFPLHTFFMLPNVYHSSVEGTRYCQAMLKGGALLEEFTKKGIRPLLAWVLPPGDIFTTRKAIVKPEDVKGMKIRTLGGTQDSAIKALGGVPVQIPAPDLYTSMQRGTVDGAIMVYSSAKSYKIHEIVKNATLGTGLGTGALAYAITEQTWQKLPADVREAMTKASEEIVTSLTKYVDDEDIQTASFFEKAGVMINRPPKDEMPRWEQALSPLTEQWIKQMEGKGLAGQQVFDAYKKAAGR